MAWVLVALALGLWCRSGICQEAQPDSAPAAAEGDAKAPEGAVADASAAEAAPEGTKKPADAAEHKPGGGHDHGSGDAHAAGGHHDEFDLSHQNATSNLTSPADARFDTAIYTFVIFLLLLIILGKFAWGPISQGLERRERGIEDQIEQARISLEKAAEQQRLYEARLAAAAEEARQIAVQARNEAEAAKEQMIAEAKAAAQRERDRAVADIAAAKNVALREISEKSVNTAIKLASNIVKREIKPNDHAQLIREAMDNFPSAN